MPIEARPLPPATLGVSFVRIPKGWSRYLALGEYLGTDGHWLKTQSVPCWKEECQPKIHACKLNYYAYLPVLTDEAAYDRHLDPKWSAAVAVIVLGPDPVRAILRDLHGVPLRGSEITIFNPKVKDRFKVVADRNKHDLELPPAPDMMEFLTEMYGHLRMPAQGDSKSAPRRRLAAFPA